MAGFGIFISVSHVSEDRSAAMQIVDELERRGVSCWIAPRDVGPGKPFDDEIADAIDASRAMLLIFSERCNESEYIRREVTVAGESQKIIIPFRIENAQPKRGLRVRLSDLHWIDGFVARERAIDELVKTFQLAEDELPQATASNEAFRQQGGMPGETSAEAKRWALDQLQHRDAEAEPQQKVEEDRPAARADRWRQKSDEAAKRTLASMSAP